MTLNSELTNLGNSVRNLSGTSDKLTVSGMANLVGQFSAFKNYGVLNNVDLNTLVDPGTYSIEEGDNKPVANWGSLIVLTAGSRVNQIYIADSNITYVRSGYANSWQAPWKKMGG